MLPIARSRLGTTAFFAVVYIFVVTEVGSRRIVAINATTSPRRGVPTL